MPSNELPIIGEEISKFGIIPRKRSLLNKALQYTPDLSIFELIDNSLDRWRSRGGNETLDIRLRFDFENENLLRIICEDNAGGVPEDRLSEVFRLGEENPEEVSIGVWGEGLKVAAISLGKEIKFFTRVGGEEGKVLHIGPDWFENDRWEITCHRSQTEIRPNSTYVVIEKVRQNILKDDINGNDPNSLLNKIGMVYSQILDEENNNNKKITIRLIVNGDEKIVQSNGFGTMRYLLKNFSYFPGYEPTRHNTEFVIDKKYGPSLRCTAIVGLTYEQQRDMCGVSMWGKGRLFELAKKEASVGFGTRGRARIPASHPTIWRLHVWLFFEGPSGLIPWQAPAKHGYNESSPFSGMISEFIQLIAGPYVSFTKVAKRIDLIPYSTYWGKLDNQGRLDEYERYLRKDTEVSLTVDEELENFIKINFNPPKELLYWDHVDNIKAPLMRPCFDADLSHSISNVIFEREKNKTQSVFKSHETIRRIIESSRPQFEFGEKRAVSDPLKSVTVRLKSRVVRVLLSQYQNIPLAEVLKILAENEARNYDPFLRIVDESFRDVIEEYVNDLRTKIPGIKGIFLFGSVAKGNTDRYSDIDILIVHDDPILTERNALDAAIKFSKRDSGFEERYKIRPISESIQKIRSKVQDRSNEFRRVLTDAILLIGDDDVKEFWRTYS